MNPTPPELDARKVKMAEGQEEYETIEAAVVDHPDFPVGGNTRVMAFRPTDEERRKISEGADIYVSLLTFGQPMNPLLVLVGKEEAAAVYNVKTTES